MPGLDGTGPLGQGAMSGRARGRCVKGADNFGRHFGQGRCGGIRAGRRFGGPGVNATDLVEQESVVTRIERLEAELQRLKQQ